MKIRPLLVPSPQGVLLPMVLRKRQTLRVPAMALVRGAVMDRRQRGAPSSDLQGLTMEALSELHTSTL